MPSRSARGRAGIGRALVAGVFLGACGKAGISSSPSEVSASSGAEPIRPPRLTGPGDWEELNTGQGAPPAGEDAAAAYDASRQRVLIYGGKDDADTVRSELWSFDLATRNWSQIVPHGAAPPPREDHTLILDAANDQLVLFGGEDGSTTRETWIFDLDEESWTEVTAETAPELEGHVAVYDPRDRRMLVFGGIHQDEAKKDEKVLENETWALDLDRGTTGYGAWSLLATSDPKPSARREHRGVYDPIRHHLIVFGGRLRTKTGFLGDVWTLDLASLTWKELETSGEAPGPLRLTALGLDPEADLLTVFGGELRVDKHGDGDEEFLVDQVWVLDLAAGRWSNRTPHPPPMYDHLGVFVPEYQGTLIYGGSSGWPGKQHETWLLRVR